MLTVSVRGGIRLWSLWLSSVTISSNSLSERPSLRWLSRRRPVDCKASSYETQGKIIRNALFWIRSKS
jgi:hypothetical protein